MRDSSAERMAREGFIALQRIILQMPALKDWICAYVAVDARTCPMCGEMDFNHIDGCSMAVDE